MDHDLLQVALRILNAHSLQLPLDPADVDILRKALPGAPDGQAPDVLAAQIVARQLKYSRGTDHS